MKLRLCTELPCLVALEAKRNRRSAYWAIRCSDRGDGRAATFVLYGGNIGGVNNVDAVIELLQELKHNTPEVNL
jgi:hypothetical protein